MSDQGPQEDSERAAHLYLTADEEEKMRAAISKTEIATPEIGEPVELLERKETPLSHLDVNEEQREEVMKKIKSHEDIDILEATPPGEDDFGPMPAGTESIGSHLVVAENRLSEGGCSQDQYLGAVHPDFKDFQYKDEATPAKPAAVSSVSSQLKNLLYLLWDSPTSFGADFHHLPRLAGARPSWRDRLTSPYSLCMLVVTVGVFLWLLISELSLVLVYHEKASTIKYVEKPDLTYSPSEAIPLMAVSMFETKQILMKAISYQRKSKNSKTAIKHQDDGILPMEYEKWSDADFSFFEEYVCQHAKIYFQRSEHFDIIDQETFTERLKFNFECQFLKIVNDQIRIFYKVPENVLGEFSNDALLSRSGRKKISEEEKSKIYFKKA